jgi:hypothetical protein
LLCSALTGHTTPQHLVYKHPLSPVLTALTAILPLVTEPDRTC